MKIRAVEEIYSLSPTNFVLTLIHGGCFPQPMNLKFIDAFIKFLKFKVHELWFVFYYLCKLIEQLNKKKCLLNTLTYIYVVILTVQQIDECYHVTYTALQYLQILLTAQSLFPESSRNCYIVLIDQDSCQFR